MIADLNDIEYAKHHLRRLQHAYGSQVNAAFALSAYYGCSLTMTAGWFQWLRKSNRGSEFRSCGVTLLLEQMPEDVNPYKPKPRTVLNGAQRSLL